MIMASNTNSNTSTNWSLPGVVMKSALLPGKLSIACLNSQSICARKLTKLDELREILSVSEVDVISISETWLNEKVSTSVLKIDGYQIVRNDRSGRLGGGIALFIRNGLKFNVLKISVDEPGVTNTKFFFI